MPDRKKLVVNLSLSHQFSISRTFPDHLRFLEERGWECHDIEMLWERTIKRFPKLLRLLPLLRNSDLVVTQEYFDAAMVSALLRLSGSRSKHLVIGLNVSGNRMIGGRSPRLSRLMNKLFFGRIDMVVVASKPEAEIFARIHDIPRNRFAFVHWAYDLPELESSFELPPRPYFCLIGRNNRDHRTFSAALQGIDANGIIISDSLPNFELPPNVQAHAALPFADCIRCIRHSVANVILVRDADRGAGHITIVTAMHCGKAQIISHVDTALDYFVPGEHALTVPLGDAQAVREAMLTLLKDPERAERMGRAAASHAARWLTHDRRRQILEDRIRAWLDSGRIDWLPAEDTQHLMNTAPGEVALSR